MRVRELEGDSFEIQRVDDGQTIMLGAIKSAFAQGARALLDAHSTSHATCGESIKVEKIQVLTVECKSMVERDHWYSTIAKEIRELNKFKEILNDPGKFSKH